MKSRLAILLALVLGLANISMARNANASETLLSVQPHVAHLKLKATDLRALAERQVVVRSVKSGNSKLMAAHGVVLLDTTPEIFAQWYRTLSALENTPSVLAAGIFKPEPSIADLEKLTIDDKDLAAIFSCRAGSSDVKLAESEIARLRAVAGAAARLTPQTKAKLASEYKKILVERVRNYLADSAAGLGVYADKDDPVNAHEAFASIAKEQARSEGHCSHIYSALENYSGAASPDSESFIYWAKQKFADLKPVINLVHVAIHREGEKIFIASKQLYSSHYTEAGLSVAELIPFTDAQGQTLTVMSYTIRLQVDMLGGLLGGMKKRMAQPKFLAGLKESLAGLMHNPQLGRRASAPAKAGL